jgi:hypothetical protein
VRFLLLTGALLVISSSVYAQKPPMEPWVDPDPDGPPERIEIGEDFGIAPSAEYRAQFTFVNPISLNTEDNRRFSTMEHRGRFGFVVDFEKKIQLHYEMDVLDGVAWGDNGTFGEVPSSDSGLQLTTREPNATRACIGFVDGDPLQADSYGYVSCEGDHIRIRRLYGQVSTPIGAIRFGRQPVTVGTSIQSADGDGRRNRWGVAGFGDQTDRVLFATKPLEGLKPKSMRNLTENEGLVTGVMYDRRVQDSAKIFSDDVHSVNTFVRFIEPDFVIGKDLMAQVFFAHRWDTQFSTRINTLGGRLHANFGGLTIGTDMAGNFGKTQEVSSAYAVITNDDVIDQDILQFGARGVMRYDYRPSGHIEERPPMLTGYFEVNYASGDADPSPGTPLTQLRWSDDANVGLLMFEHVLRFQSARAALAGAEIVQRLGATSFAPERVHTRGDFTNAIAIFPQIDFRPHDDVMFRVGVLVAWAPEPVFDPVASLQAEDGDNIEDDLINFVGGPPGDFYGTELDWRFQWRFLDHFAFDYEGAILFPGDAFHDANGQAVHSFMTQGRTSIFF